jgi:predicted kinase
MLSRMRPTLFVMVGLPGAGKTTLAKRLEAEHSALRLTPDEWMLPLFGAADLTEERGTLEALLWGIAERSLRLGLNVVLDYGLWARCEREDYRARGQAAGARVEITYLNVPKEELWRRLEIRNENADGTAPRITRDELEQYIAMFQPPTDDEIESWRS